MKNDEVKKRLLDFGEGVLIEEDVLGIVAKVQQYDPNLVIQLLDPKQAKHSIDLAPYRIMERCPDGVLRLVFSVWQLDDRVLERLYAHDKYRFNVLEIVDNQNEKAKKAQERRYRDESEALHEMVKDTLQSPKETYTAENPITGQRHTFRSYKQSRR